jgi:hypothetical protein
MTMANTQISLDEESKYVTCDVLSSDSHHEKTKHLIKQQYSEIENLSIHSNQNEV